jgi:hypothetical protein
MLRKRPEIKDVLAAVGGSWFVAAIIGMFLSRRWPALGVLARWSFGAYFAIFAASILSLNGY